MRKVRDTFLHFIADNIGAVAVHVLRDDPEDRSAGALQMNAVNLSFLNVSLGNGSALSSVQAVIDIVNDDENTAADWVQSVWSVLGAAFFTQIKDYTDPSAPALTGANIFWPTRNITFRRVASKLYCHYSCVLTLRFNSV